MSGAGGVRIFRIESSAPHEGHVSVTKVYGYRHAADVLTVSVRYGFRTLEGAEGGSVARIDRLFTSGSKRLNMLSQRELSQRFARGAEDGYASNVSIMRLVGGWTALVGYGWAVYAVNTGDRITAYRDWYGHSPATSCQLTKMGVAHPADNTAGDDYRDRVIVDSWIRDCATVSDFQDSPPIEL